MDAYIEDREYHEKFMREAINMAEQALRNDETPVGCVFVHKGEVVARGMNATNKTLNGTAHCEFVAISNLHLTSPSIPFTEITLYVTVEPCIMCASFLRQLSIAAVYFGCANERFGGVGGVMNVHDDPGVDRAYPVYGGLFKEECIMLLRRFYVQENEKAPEPHKKANRELKTEIVAHRGKARREKPVSVDMKGETAKLASLEIKEEEKENAAPVTEGGKENAGPVKEEGSA